MNRNSQVAMITGITIGLGVGAAWGFVCFRNPARIPAITSWGCEKDRFNQTKDCFSDVGDRIRDVGDRFSDVVESGKDFARQAQKLVDHVKGHLQDSTDAGTEGLSRG